MKYQNLYNIYKAVREILPEGELGLVGGCVRDTLLGLEPKDYDFNTNLTPSRVEELAKKAGRRVYTIGKKYGTIGFKVKVKRMVSRNEAYDYWWEEREEFIYVEVTTYRDETYDPNSRKPIVTFGTDLREDILRRDFTINSIWYGSLDPEQEPDIKDLLAGWNDLDLKRIKSCRDPQKMINDDPLRILRAVRFACKFGFNIEPNLYGICRKKRERLWTVAIERQTVELDKILTSDAAERGLEILKDLGILDMLLPELDKITPVFADDPDVAWRKLLHYVGGELRYDDWGSEHYVYNKSRHNFLCQGIAARFKFSNKRLEVINE